jgi:predicted transcriptional regulator of viral defense system
MATMTLESWIDSLQARGRYSLLRSEALEQSGLSPDAVRKALQRSVKKGRLIKLKDYFYVIVPLEYASAGAPPATWFAQDLMAAIGIPYYVGLLSAASLHGASHQQPQEFQILTDRSVRTIMAGRTRLRFFASKYIARCATQEVKTPTGLIRVSTPEATVVDLVRFSRAAGRLDHVATVIGELAPVIDPKKLVAAVRVVSDLPNTQRLGFILDQARQRRLSDPIHAWLGRHKTHVLPLRSGRAATGVPHNRRWNLLVNGPIEVDA